MLSQLAAKFILTAEPETAPAATGDSAAAPAFAFS